MAGERVGWREYKRQVGGQSARMSVSYRRTDKSSSFLICGSSVGLSHATPEYLRRDHADCLEPRFDQPRPCRNRKPRLPEAEGVSPFRVYMQFRWHPIVLQLLVVSQRIAGAIHVIVLRVQQERRWRVASDVKIRIQRRLVVVKEMPRIQRH